MTLTKSEFEGNLAPVPGGSFFIYAKA